MNVSLHVPQIEIAMEIARKIFWCDYTTMPQSNKIVTHLIVCGHFSDILFYAHFNESHTQLAWPDSGQSACNRQNFTHSMFEIEGMKSERFWSLKKEKIKEFNKANGNRISMRPCGLNQMC